MTNKYNIGDKVWFIDNNIVVNKDIVFVFVKGGEVYYGFNQIDWGESMYPHKCVFQGCMFKTKEDLLKSL